MERAYEDVIGLAAEARDTTRCFRDLPTTIVASIRLVRAAAGSMLYANFATQAVLALLAAAQVVAAAWALQSLVDLDRHTTSTRAAIVPFLALVVPTILIALVGVVRQQLQRIMTEQVEQATWERVLDAAGAVDLEIYESPAFHDQLRRVEANALVRPAMVSTSLGELAGGIFGVVTVGITVVALAPLVIPLLVLAGVPLVFAARRLGAIEFDFAVRVTPVLRRRRYLRELMVGRVEAKELRALGAGEAFRERHRALAAEYLATLRMHARRTGIIGLLAGAASAAATLLGLLLVFALVADGAATLAQAGAIVVAIRLLEARLQSVSGAAGRLVESSLFLRDLESFERTARDHVEQRQGRPASSLDELRLHDVSFRYPGSAADTLRRVSAVIRRGEVVALVGENGSGKTTLSKIVAQLYDATTGTVEWNGEDVHRLDPVSRRQHVSVTFQDFARFAVTAAENVGIGGGTLAVDEERVAAAAAVSGADEVLRTLPRGLSTGLGKEFADGTDLSTGQWQRIALARAFYRDADLVVLDEPTASLDPRAEQALFDAVRALFRDRAVLLITHRLASVRDADRIYVMKGGRVVEQGRHEQLLDDDGLYAELFTLQATGFADLG